MEHMYFIEDPTVTEPNGAPHIATGATLPSFFRYLENVCVRKFGKTRAQFVVDQSDYFGHSENTDAVFYDMMRTNKIRMGIVRNGKPMECDVLREQTYSSARSEYGD